MNVGNWLLSQDYFFEFPLFSYPKSYNNGDLIFKDLEHIS